MGDIFGYEELDLIQFEKQGDFSIETQHCRIFQNTDPRGQFCFDHDPDWQISNMVKSILEPRTRRPWPSLEQERAMENHYNPKKFKMFQFFGYTW